MLKRIKIKAIINVCFISFYIITTLFFMPKWYPDTEKNPAQGIYYEEENSIDVLMLGSCNMYTSFSPVLFYEKHGITAYDMCCPDQTFTTSYFYLKNIIKKHSPKVVVLEALFLMNPNTSKREHYNREAIDYFPASLEKLELINATVEEEVEVMQSYDSNSPGKVLTYAGYLFPLLRYHNRNDLSIEDFKFYLHEHKYSTYKGSVPFFTYTNMDGLNYCTSRNGETIREDAKKYLPKIKELCEKKDIDFFVMKSPNGWRWNSEQTNTAKEYVESLGIDFIDSSGESFSNYYDYEIQKETGRLNIYGMKKLTSEIGEYIINKYHLSKTKLSEENRNRWDECVKKLYQAAEKNNARINEGELAQLKNVENGISIRWNYVEDCNMYEVYRSDSTENYVLIGKSDKDTFIDEDVKNGCFYNYYIVPGKGKLKGKKSNTLGRAYIESPKSVNIKPENDGILISWDNNNEIDYTSISVIGSSGYKYEKLGSTKNDYYLDERNKVKKENLSYRIRFIKKINDIEWESAPVIIYP